LVPGFIGNSPDTDREPLAQRGLLAERQSTVEERYRAENPLQVEVLLLLGDVAVGDQGPALHLHAVLGKADGSVVGGHLIEAYVRPTLEVILIQPPSYLRKRKDPETGLALIDIA
jgi:predicted DNA-binding protein with PD1-like motif